MVDYSRALWGNGREMVVGEIEATDPEFQMKATMVA